MYLVAGQLKPYQHLVESMRKFPSQEDFKYMIESADFRVDNIQQPSGVHNIIWCWYTVQYGYACVFACTYDGGLGKGFALCGNLLTGGEETKTLATIYRAGLAV
ncbi:2-methoxy-6-polyprenyl-1,4-benzoquinol methylase, mitochondrial [Aphis craccivora]|uniref:2-methoxy-6-polyprenyl-1,4-benzoquinol methylase, mitochondrial n=1 Tax=Aphis craccivora TaxID=307492 RepID=A0A6G0YGI9_APHCR|nr:2-methoxy-6-polyprenyl-1,4-benzoquinol methylase, mitochondrial [Aphis craccivora]